MGALTRKLQRLNSNDTAAVTLPKDFIEDLDAEFGDEVSIRDFDREEGTITLEL